MLRMTTRLAAAAAATVLAVTAGCAGNAADYDTYSAYYDGLAYFRRATGPKLSADEFAAYAERVCGKDPDELAGDYAGVSDPTNVYFLHRIACGAGTADAALEASDVDERAKSFMSGDFERAGEQVAG